MSKYFNTYNTPESLKSTYRSLCKTLHPDVGGSHSVFIEMKSEYDEKLKYLSGKPEYDNYMSLLKYNTNLIDNLFVKMKTKRYKKIWVYYKFIGEAVLPNISSFKYMAIVLGYKSGWAYYKYQEYNKKN